MSVDAIIVGAGFSGAVLAERFASQLGWKVLVLEQRPHIGGNCYDEPDEHGVLVHRYGPHLFHTDNVRVWEYLSAFTAWRPYEHKVLSSIDGQLVPIPFNLNSIDRLFDADTAARMQAALVSRFGLGARVPILRLKEEDEPLLQELADFVYRKAFLNYTTKQWGVKPEEISPEVTGRVPVVVDRDDRYFTDPYQAVPAEGYTKLFEKLLDHPHITVRVNTPFNAVGGFDPATGAVQFEGAPFGGLLVFTGMVDELFGRDLGALPYRSIRFDFQHHAVPVYQPATTVNYPNEHRYTRITEFKHLTGQACAGTSIVFEYPQAYDPADPDANVPYYPIFDERSKAAYTAYADRLGGHARVVAVGRLAQYRYFDMDDAVANALQVFDRIAAAQG